MEEKKDSSGPWIVGTAAPRSTYFIIVLWGVVILLVGFVLGGTISLPPKRSSVYEIPMAKGQPWRVTSFQGKVYVLIEAPSMPEDITRKDGPTR